LLIYIENVAIYTINPFALIEFNVCNWAGTFKVQKLDQS